MKKARILCLHGKFQSGAIMSNKIAGARRKLERVYDLDFLNGPIRLDGGGLNNSNNLEDIENSSSSSGSIGSPSSGAADNPLFAWFTRDEQEDGSFTYNGIREAFDYILEETKGISYDAMIGFSQGGTVATALAASGALGSSVKAVITAGAPLIEDAFFEVDTILSRNNQNGVMVDNVGGRGWTIPKLHLAEQWTPWFQLNRRGDFVNEAEMDNLLFMSRDTCSLPALPE
jgi:pimeloyl-ACP methyl ester carboxylesterase